MAKYKMNIGLIDVDEHNFLNFALMCASAYYKSKGHNVAREDVLKQNSGEVFRLLR